MVAGERFEEDLSEEWDLDGENASHSLEHQHPPHCEREHLHCHGNSCTGSQSRKGHFRSSQGAWPVALGPGSLSRLPWRNDFDFQAKMSIFFPQKCLQGTKRLESVIESLAAVSMLLETLQNLGGEMTKIKTPRSTPSGDGHLCTWTLTLKVSPGIAVPVSYPELIRRSG